MTPLREYRKARKLTLGKVAVDVGVSESQLSRIEREGTTLLSIALKLEEITKRPAVEFLKERAA